jgi:voltage-gated potassium channel
VLNVEPAESGYETWGDALWWSIVTFTTVGYGDLFPVTAAGRLAGVLLLLTGLAALGSVASALTSVISGDDQAAAAESAATADLTAELHDLRREVAELTDLVRRDRG